jgi:ubiquinone/menaquinone biosynthesis C-methylase UbiE
MNHPEKIETQNEQSTPFVVLEMFQYMWITRCIHLVVKLGIADLLTEGARSVSELAEATKTHEASLYRILRALASCDIFTETTTSYFDQTALSQALCSKQPDSLYGLARLWSLPAHWALWGDLEYSVQTGLPVSNRQNEGKDTWAHIPPEIAKMFNEGMTSFSALVNDPIIEAYDFSGISTLVDIGGGQGSLLTKILQKYPTMNGILLDRSSVIVSAAEVITGEVAQRCKLVAGSFFETIPEGADGYIIKQVFHNWSDDDCITILKSCRQAMKPEGRILIVDRVIVPDNKATPYHKFWDILMLITTNGRERTEKEFAQLYQSAGFTLTRIIPTGTPVTIIEGVPILP